MTAINILVQPDAVYLFGDGASYDEEGRIVSLGGKAHVLSALSTAILVSGRSIAAPLIAHYLQLKTADFDQLEATIAARLPGILDEVTDLFGEDESETARRLQATSGQGVELFVAGWSEKRKRGVAFRIASVPRGDDEAFTVVEREAGFMAPPVTTDAWTEAFGCPPGAPPDSMENFALTMLELQRQTTRPDGRHVIGGLVEMVAVRRDRIESQILKRWPADMVGEFIAPEPVDWAAWRLAHPVYTNESRLARDMRLRRERKLRRA